MRYKLCKFYENRARDTPLRGRLYSTFRSNLSKNFNLGSYTLVVAPMEVKFGTEEGTLGPLLRAKFHPHLCNVSPLQGEKQFLKSVNI